MMDTNMIIEYIYSKYDESKYEVYITIDYRNYIS